MVPLALLVAIAILVGCANPTTPEESGDTDPDPDPVNTERPDSLGAALSFMVRFPDSVGNQYLSSSSTSGSVSGSTINTVDASQTIDGPRTPADYLYDEIGVTLDMFAWLDRNGVLPSAGSSIDLGDGSVSRFSDGTALGNRIASYLTNEWNLGSNSFDLGFAEAVSTSVGYNIYVTFDPDGSGSPEYLYFIVVEEDGEIVSVAYHDRSTFSGALPVDGSLVNDTYPYEVFGQVSWSTDGVPTFDFVKFFDRDKDGVYYEADDPGSVLRSTVDSNTVDMVLSTREAGLAYRTTNGTTQFAGMHASETGGAYLFGYFDPATSGSFDTDGGFELYLFDAAGGYLGEGQSYNPTDNDTSTLPTALTDWTTRWLAYGSASVTFSSTYSGGALLWDNNDSVASTDDTGDTNWTDDAYWIDVNTNGSVDSGTDVQVGGGTGDAQTVVRTRRPAMWFPQGLPVVTFTNPEFDTFFSWSAGSDAEGWLDRASTYLSGSAVGLGSAVDADEGDIELFMQDIIDSVPQFPSEDTFPALP